MTELITVLGNPRPGSRTATFASAFVAALLGRLRDRGVRIDGIRTIDLAQTVAVSFDGPVAPAAAELDAVAAVTGAGVLVVATPSYKGTYTGVLKVFFDQFGHLALSGVAAAVPIGIAASPAHVSATAADLARLLGEIGAYVPAVVGVDEAEFADIAAAAEAHAAAVVDLVANALAG